MFPCPCLRGETGWCSKAAAAAVAPGIGTEIRRSRSEERVLRNSTALSRTQANVVDYSSSTSTYYKALERIYQQKVRFQHLLCLDTTLG